MKKLLPILLAICLLFVSTIAAGEDADAEALLQEGLAAFDSGDYVTAFQRFQKAADAGLAGGQYNLGICWRDGNGTEKDEEKAVELFQLSAKQGYAPAQTELGICYLTGTGAEQDYELAFSYLVLAATQGDARAKYIMGDCYENGKGVEQSYLAAALAYWQAYRQGVEEAYEKALLCYQKADAQGDVKEFIQEITKKPEE